MAVRKASDLVAEAKSKIDNLGVEEAQKEIEGGALVVDLREPEELAATGRIPGSVHVPRGMLEFRADPETPYHLEPFDRSRRVILHCASGGRSALAGATLKEMGYENVAHLEGGFKAWVEAEGPVEPAT